MNEAIIISLASESIKTILFIAGPLLITAMSVGILVSVIQAVTQINETTLTFIPKMIAVVIVLLLMAPWMLEILQNYTIEIFENIQIWIK